MGNMDEQMIKLAYWDTRGLAQSIRFLLEHLGVAYDDRRYCVKGSAPEWDLTDWLDVKESLGFLLPNLPYLIDGTVYITETTAILRYLDRRFQLMPGDSALHVRSDILLSATQACFDRFILMCYSPSFLSIKPEYEEWLAGYLPRLDTALEGCWFCHQTPTSVDFHVYEMLFQNNELFPNSLLKYPKLTKFMERIENLESIQRYRNSSKYIDYPINNRQAVFGSELLRPVA